ncbi:MAG: PLD nuclease N-terminal domain-containing protein [Anaerolineae bacterium]
MDWKYYLIAVPAGLLYLALLVFALRDWILHGRTRHLSRWVWLLIIVVFSIVGPAAYLGLGRGPKPLDRCIKGGTAFT